MEISCPTENMRLCQPFSLLRLTCEKIEVVNETRNSQQYGLAEADDTQHTRCSTTYIHTYTAVSYIMMWCRRRRRLFFALAIPDITFSFITLCLVVIALWRQLARVHVFASSSCRYNVVANAPVSCFCAGLTFALVMFVLLENRMRTPSTSSWLLMLVFVFTSIKRLRDSLKRITANEAPIERI